MKYKLVKNYSNELAGIIATDEVTNLIFTIPLNEANTDYQEYLEWVSKGNTAEEAD
tara:strand:+ start:354 stop:521 length:168 start_codon:yes stop_codon:yes gene_type:complete